MRVLSREARDEAVRMQNSLMVEGKRKPSRHWQLIGMRKEESLMGATKLTGTLKMEEESQNQEKCRLRRAKVEARTR